VQDLHNIIGESTLGHEFIALHEHKHGAAGNQSLDALLQISVHGGLGKKSGEKGIQG
jgi:hypothetical protein